jgi:hypothetical protein
MVTSDRQDIHRKRDEHQERTHPRPDRRALEGSQSDEDLEQHEGQHRKRKSFGLNPGMESLFSPATLHDNRPANTEMPAMIDKNTTSSRNSGGGVRVDRGSTVRQSRVNPGVELGVVLVDPNRKALTRRERFCGEDRSILRPLEPSPVHPSPRESAERSISPQTSLTDPTSPTQVQVERGVV